jgi:hypothetical protein
LPIPTTGVSVSVGVIDVGTTVVAGTVSVTPPGVSVAAPGVSVVAPGVTVVVPGVSVGRTNVYVGVGAVVEGSVSVGVTVVGTGVVGDGGGLIMGQITCRKTNRHSKSNNVTRSTNSRTRKTLDVFLQRSLRVLIAIPPSRLQCRSSPAPQYAAYA